jgi:hypothetical protein
MIVWGGYNILNYYNTGAIYDPAGDTWTPISTNNAPAGRIWQTAVWTGNKMIVWGGYANTVYYNTGGIYDPAADTWTPTSTVNAPSGRDWHSAVWTGSKMIIWGGYNGSIYFNSGGIYDPATDTWTSTTTENAPNARWHHSAVWTGNKMIAWGGFGNSTYYNTGGIYYNPVVVSIRNISTEIPEIFSLSQNYPNPFNPSTVIRFQLSVAGNASLKIIDLLGREIATLVNEKLDAGTYKVDWNASEFPSGVYFYRLTAEGYGETRKMLLIR